MTSTASFEGMIARLNVKSVDGRVLAYDDDPRHFPSMPVPVMASDLTDGSSELTGRIEQVSVRQESYGAELHASGWLDLDELFRMFPDLKTAILPRAAADIPDIPLIGCGVFVAGGDIREDLTVGGVASGTTTLTIDGPWTLRGLHLYDVGTPVVWPGVGLRLSEITMDGEL